MRSGRAADAVAALRRRRRAVLVALALHADAVLAVRLAGDARAVHVVGALRAAAVVADRRRGGAVRVAETCAAVAADLVAERLGARAVRVREAAGLAATVAVADRRARRTVGAGEAGDAPALGDEAQRGGGAAVTVAGARDAVLRHRIADRSRRSCAVGVTDTAHACTGRRVAPRLVTTAGARRSAARGLADVVARPTRRRRRRTVAVGRANLAAPAHASRGAGSAVRVGGALDAAQRRIAGPRRGAAVAALSAGVEARRDARLRRVARAARGGDEAGGGEQDARAKRTKERRGELHAPIVPPPLRNQARSRRVQRQEGVR